MREVKFTIPGELPDLNTIIAESKRGNRGWQPYNKIKKEYTEAVAWIAKAKRVKFKKIDLDINWVCKNRMKDPDNISGGGAKFVLDGLVDAGVIDNDGWKQVGSIRHSFDVDKHNPRVEVTIKEAG